VILLKNSNEWNLFPAKRRILEKKREERARIESKRDETSYEEAPCFKQKEDVIYKLLGEILSKERKKGDHIFL
jgi:hypothetical protein